MVDIRCTQCNRLLAKKFVGRYIEIKCPKCSAINIMDYDKNWDLTGVVGSSRVKSNKSAMSA